MQKEYKNKAVDPEKVKTKSEEALEEYHFPGGLEYEPLTVRARSREEAEEIWLKQRKKVEPNQTINNQ